MSIPRTHTYRQTQTQTRTHTIRNAKPPSPFPLNKHANTRTHAHTHTRARSRTHIHTRRTRERMHPDRDTRTTHTHTHARLRLPASWCTVAHSAAGGSARPSAAILAQMWGGGAANGWTPEVLGTVCGTVLRRACIAANVGKQSDRQHRVHCTSIDPAVRNAAGCGPSQRLRLLARGSGKYLTPAEVLGSLTSEAPVCGRYIRMQCIAPLRQAQLQSSTRGLISIARRRSRQSLKLTVPGARSLFCSRHDTARTLHAWQRIGNSGAKLEARVRCGETS